MLALRLLTAVVLLAGFIAAALKFGRLEFTILVAVILALAAQEWGKLCGWATRGAASYAAGLVAAYAIFAWACFPLSVHDTPELILFGVALAYWCLLVPVWLRRGLGRGPAQGALAGAFTLLPCAIAMAAVPGEQLLFALALVWVADTAAYMAGRIAGTRKLAPAISPGKTWEGVGGALLGTLTYATVCGLIVPWLNTALRPAVWPVFLGGVAILCALSVLGDLFESAMKRRAGVKDSGVLLPGHGGVLDRIDSVTASLPGAALLLNILGAG